MLGNSGRGTESNSVGRTYDEASNYSENNAPKPPLPEQASNVSSNDSNEVTLADDIEGVINLEDVIETQANAQPALLQARPALPQADEEASSEEDSSMKDEESVIKQDKVPQSINQERKPQ